MYFSYVPRLVDFVADSDIESLVLSRSSATHNFFIGRLVSPIQKDGIRNERGPVGLVTLPLKGWIS